MWGAEELVPIGPEKTPRGPEKAPTSPEKARFPRKDFPPIFSENLGLKPPFVSPRLDFPKKSQEGSCKPGGSYVVHELSREPAMLQVGLSGEVLTRTSLVFFLSVFPLFPRIWGGSIGISSPYFLG